MQAVALPVRASNPALTTPRGQVQNFVEIFTRNIKNTLIYESKRVNIGNPYLGQGFYSFWIIGKSGKVYASQGKEGPINAIENIEKIRRRHLSDYREADIPEPFYLLRIASPATEKQLYRHFSVSCEGAVYPYHQEIEDKLNEEALEAEKLGEESRSREYSWEYGRWFDFFVRRNSLKAALSCSELRQNIAITLEKTPNLSRNKGDPFSGQALSFEILVAESGHLLATSGPQLHWLVKTVDSKAKCLEEIDSALFQEKTYILKVEVPETSVKLKKHFNVTMADNDGKECPFLAEISIELNRLARIAEAKTQKVEKTKEDEWIYGRWFDAFKDPSFDLNNIS